VSAIAALEAGPANKIAQINAAFDREVQLDFLMAQAGNGGLIVEDWYVKHEPAMVNIAG
jgi:hypothetical protein